MSTVDQQLTHVPLHEMISNVLRAHGVRGNVLAEYTPDGSMRIGLFREGMATVVVTPALTWPINYRKVADDAVTLLLEELTRP